MSGILAAAILGASLGGADLPIFGPGPLTNLGGGDAAVTNASAHVAWSLAVPLAGYAVGGRRGMWAAGLGWIVGSLAQETFFHAPPGGGGRGYPAEVRTDLLTRIVPCAGVLVYDLIKHGSPLAPDRAGGGTIQLGPEPPLRLDLPPAVMDAGKPRDGAAAAAAAVRYDAMARETVLAAAELRALGRVAAPRAPPIGAAALLARSDPATPVPDPPPRAGAGRRRARRS